MALKTSLVIGGDAAGAAAALLDVEQELVKVEAAAKRSTATISAANDQMAAKATVSTRQAAAGYQNLGRQAQDVAVQLQGGTNIGTILAQQGPQVADALAQMGGRFAGFASFMAGPYGAAIIVGAGVLLNQLLPALLQTTNAAEANADAQAKVEAASNGLAAAQSALGNMFDLTTGRIKAQNEMLILNARLAALNLRAEAAAEKASSARTLAFAKSGLGLSWTNRIAGAVGLPVGESFGRAQSVDKLTGDLRAGRISREDALRQTEKLDFTGLKITRQDLEQAIINDLSNGLKTRTADLIDQSLADKSLAPGLRKTDTNKPKKGRAGPSAAQRAELGEDIADKIGNIRDQFSDLPSVVEKSNKAMRQLNDIASDIERRKPPNYLTLKADLATAKKAVEDSLIRPFSDYMEKAREAQEIDRLLAAGKDDQAAALKDILALEKQMGPLSQQQLGAVLATVQAERQRSMVLRDQRALISANINAVQDMRSALEQTVGDALRGRFSLDNVLSSIGNSFIQLTSKRLIESMFGETLRALEDQASGQDTVRRAGEEMASAMGTGTAAVADFATAVRDAIARIESPSSPSGGTTAANDNGGDTSGDIIVNGPRKAVLSGDKTGNLLVDMVDKMLGRIGIRLPQVVTDGLKGALAGIESRLPEMMAGAFAGQAASKLILGSNSNSAGSAIGGVLGQAAGKALTKGMTGLLGSLGGPLGAIAGGVLGSLVGGLFSSKPHGTATITSTTDKAQVSGSTSEIASGLNQMSTGVQGALKQIADRLGADVGSFAVSIGQYKDYYQVSSVANDPYLGKSNYNKKSSNALYDGKDASAAVAAAIQNAIADGGVKGLSAAVEKALKSSPDIDVALAEALKVQSVELAVGGLGAQLEKQFKDFERQAADRLRIARQYGFDVVKMEERNAADRLALSKKLAADQIGSLQSLIDSMTSGSLFEGSAIDQRQAVLDQIAATKADAAAGVEGAADKLAGLLEQLNNVSRDAYGTTGGFAADRATILDEARATIAAANQRVSDAAKASDPALTQTNAALNENNDQNAAMLAALGDNNALLAALVAQGGVTDWAGLAALASTGKAFGY